MVIILNPAVRHRFVPDPEAGSTRQFVRGTERCNRGDIVNEHVAECLLLDKKGQKTRTSDRREERRLVAEIKHA